MEIYKKMYYRLFNSVTDALAAMAQQNFGAAADLLRRAQIDSEALFLDGSDGESEQVGG